jgi:hypothetical protein
LIRALAPLRYAMDGAVHPYRQIPTDSEAGSAMTEEWILYGALCGVGAIPIAIALLRGGSFGARGARPTEGLTASRAARPISWS